MKLKSILVAFVIMGSGSLFAQNVTKADLVNLENRVNALSQKVEQLEGKLERVMSENINLVEQLKLKTVASVTDGNGIKWDIVKVEPNADNNDVVLTLRLTNNSGFVQKLFMGFDIGVAVDSDTNRSNNVYTVKAADQNPDLSQFASGVSVNIQAVIKGVPTTSSYMQVIKFPYGGLGGSPKTEAKFTGIHIPW